MKQYFNKIQKYQYKIYQLEKLLKNPKLKDNIFYDDFVEELKAQKKSFRSFIRSIDDNLHYPKFIVKDGEDGGVIINIFEYDGTKEQFVKWWYDNFFEPRPTGLYDCTGQPFTEWVKIGHVKNNIYKVAECYSFDI